VTSPQAAAKRHASDEAGTAGVSAVADVANHELVPGELLHRVIARLNPRRVILIGSRARGEADSDSDWDLIVVVDDDVADERIGWRALDEARRGFAGAVDLLPCREAAFRRRAGVVGSLPWIAATHGVVVYQRGDTA